ncbi:hypothetical protein QYM36_009097 [Artemia franciscana]|uniref:Peptidase C2 calpain domain-containing protein n=1 Tax=Artemia franciscana TaxID=6661 RepID=A0AA88L6S2_ARTSF|nr:hypothetical protein QYM36_009097 [Artemia franciscana]
MVVVHLNPQSFDKVYEDEEYNKIWYLRSFQGAWVREESAGGLEKIRESPPFRFTIEDSDEDEGRYALIVCLTQKSRRSQHKFGERHPFIGFIMNKINDAEKPEFLGQSEYLNNRTICGRSEAFPGTFSIKAVTLDSSQEREFIIRLFKGISNSMQEKGAEQRHDL